MKCFVLPRAHNGGGNGQDMWHAWDKGEMNAGLYLEGLKKRDGLEGLRVDGRKLLQLILHKQDGRGSNGS